MRFFIFMSHVCCLAVARRVVSCLVLSYLVLSYAILVLSCLFFSFLVFGCLVLSSQASITRTPNNLTFIGRNVSLEILPKNPRARGG